MTTRVGIVGAGQLARMMGEAKDGLDVELTVLAATSDDPAVATCDAFIVGEAEDELALRALARTSDVITFDHELVRLEQLRRLERDGVTFRPGADALAYAVDKAHQRRAFLAAGLPVPRFAAGRRATDGDIADLLASLAAAPVVKAATGGYDGRGVAFPATLDEARTLIDEWGERGEVLVEERLNLSGEVAQMVARGVDGTTVTYPVVTTVQAKGMCVETHYPADLARPLLETAEVLTRRIADLVGLVGVMAVEYFVTPDGLVINEVALRPHNSGHWTIEGTTHSQFENHLRCVAGLAPLAVRPCADAVVMVNLVGGPEPSSPERARAVAGVFVHDYGKAWRAQRKLGHVTALGDSVEHAHVTAWKGARAYGTPTEETV